MTGHESFEGLAPPSMQPEDGARAAKLAAGKESTWADAPGSMLPSAEFPRRLTPGGEPRDAPGSINARTAPRRLGSVHQPQS